MAAYQALMPQCHAPLELGGRMQAVTDRGGNRRELGPLRPEQRAPTWRAIGCLPGLVQLSAASRSSRASSLCALTTASQYGQAAAMNW